MGSVQRNLRMTKLGVVAGKAGNDLHRVKLDDGTELLCTRGGGLRVRRVWCAVGDRVDVEVLPEGRGRISSEAQIAKRRPTRQGGAAS